MVIQVIQVYFHANQTGFTTRLVLKQRHKVTQKWPTVLSTVRVLFVFLGDWHCAYVLLYRPRQLEVEDDQ